MIKIQEEDFHIDQEIAKIKNKHPNVGAVSRSSRRSAQPREDQKSQRSPL